MWRETELSDIKGCSKLGRKDEELKGLGRRCPEWGPDRRARSEGSKWEKRRSTHEGISEKRMVNHDFKRR